MHTSPFVHPYEIVHYETVTNRDLVLSQCQSSSTWKYLNWPWAGWLARSIGILSMLINPRNCESVTWPLAYELKAGIWGVLLIVGRQHDGFWVGNKYMLSTLYASLLRYLDNNSMFLVVGAQIYVDAVGNGNNPLQDWVLVMDYLYFLFSRDSLIW